MGLFSHPEGIYRAVGNAGPAPCRRLPGTGSSSLPAAGASRRLAVCFIMFFSPLLLAIYCHSSTMPMSRLPSRIDTVMGCPQSGC